MAKEEATPTPTPSPAPAQAPEDAFQREKREYLRSFELAKSLGYAEEMAKGDVTKKLQAILSIRKIIATIRQEFQANQLGNVKNHGVALVLKWAKRSVKEIEESLPDDISERPATRKHHAS